jgi:hypothetical protein
MVSTEYCWDTWCQINVFFAVVRSAEKCAVRVGTLSDQGHYIPYKLIKVLV